jgi:hypothetical protein
MGQSKEFAKPSFVYSYLWPNDVSSPYNFQWYLRGFQERSTAIRECLEANRRCVALVVDIEKFYPSIVQTEVCRRVQARIDAAVFSKETAEVARQLVSHVCLPLASGLGICTGPDICHVLGDVALSPVDSACSQRYVGRYFRYVDDIVLVVEPEEVKSALEFLREVLAREGLRLNEDKTDYLSSDEWLQHGPVGFRSGPIGPFAQLQFRLKVFLSHRPGEFGSLARALWREGVRLPLARFLRASFAAPFRQRLR